MADNLPQQPRERSETMARRILREEQNITGQAARDAVMQGGGWRAFLYARNEGPMRRIDAVAALDGLICQCCYFRPLHGREVSIDHVVATKSGGADTVENWAILCHSCNILKSNTRSIDEMRKLAADKGWAYPRPSGFRDVLDRVKVEQLTQGG